MARDRLEGIRACIFGAYGTLFDYRSAASRCRDVLGENFDQVNALWREKQLQYSWLRAIQGRHVDFWQVTGEALDFALDTAAIADSTVRDRLMATYLKLDAFPEVPDMLKRLNVAGLKTAILSNGSPEMLDAAVRNAGIGSLLDAVLSVEAVGVYKPHPKVYQYAIDQLGIKAGEIAFQSSNAWDAHAAALCGMRVIWCNRYRQRPERLPGLPDFEIASLAELPDLVGA
jgi:2-haloacid dehalogenase